MSRGRKVLVFVGIVVVVLGGAVVYARPLLLTGTGYAAHNACAVHFVSGRPIAAAEEDLPPNPLVPIMTTSVDDSSGEATASVYGLFSQTAYFTRGLGCTLADDDPALSSPTPVATDDGIWPDGEAVADPPPEIDRDALAAVLDQAFAEDDPQGRAVGTRAIVIVQDGRIVAERYADGFEATTPQLGWSMAKSVTNAMVGRLVNDGRLALDQDSLLPSWAGDGRAQITINDLLTMTSGLAWDEAYSLGSVITEMLYLRPDMGAFAADQPLAHPVGQVQEYSSGTTNILCDVLQQQTDLGTSLVHDLVFSPLGMASAILESDADGGLVCSSYLWATPRDWARFGLWFAQGGEWDGQALLPDDWIDYSTTPVRAGGEDEGHAAHWWINELSDGTLTLPSAPLDTFWASGHDGQRIFVIPSTRTVIVRMGFTPEISSDDLGFDDLVARTLAAVGQGQDDPDAGGLDIPRPVVTAPPTTAETAGRAERLTVTDRKDGDSFVASDGVEYRVGLINTPERGECGGTEASARTYELLADGFVVEAYATDNNGRSVARISTPSGDLGVLLAQEGFADDRYLDGFRSENPAYARELDEAFASARRDRPGLFADCWRELDRQPTAAPVPDTATQQQASPAGVHQGRTGQWVCHAAYVECLPDGPDLDCRDVAHQVRLFGRADPFRLDGNSTTATDGVGCDSYEPFDSARVYPYETR